MLFVLFTCLKFVVWFLKATGVRAEILLTLRASHTILTHALSCFSRNWFIVTILLVHIYLSLLDVHDVFTAAPYEIWILFHKISQDNLVILLSLIAEVHIKFLLRDLSFAIIFRASNIEASFSLLKKMSKEALLVSHMHAVSGPYDDFVLFDLVLLGE